MAKLIFDERGGRQELLPLHRVGAPAVERQYIFGYSGHRHVICLYVNPELNQFWLIDYRLFASDEDGKTKLDQAKEMFDLVIHAKQLEFRCVLMDTWYATRQFMLQIERNGKLYYCPIQDNRQVDEGDGA